MRGSRPASSREEWLFLPSTPSTRAAKTSFCSPEGLDAADRGSTAATVSTVAFTVGVLGAAIGTYLLVTGKPDAKATSAAKGPTLDAGWVPGGGMVTVGGRIW